MALNTEVGGANSNSYATVSYANAFFAGHFSLAKTAAWNALSTARKESALRRACQQIETLKFLDNEYGSGPLPFALIIDNHYDLTVHKLYAEQRLQFPRNIDIDSANVAFVPTDIMDAQCEQAVFLLSVDEASAVSMQNGIVEEAVTAGDVKAYTRYAEGKQASFVSPVSVELLRPYFRNSSRVRRA